MVKRLNMMHLWDDVENTPSASKKVTTLVFKELTAVLPFRFKFQLDNLDIHYKTTTDFPEFPDDNT